ncbi:MAG: hypothetical protein R6U65_03590 [Perlabentimonas sp.]
MDYRKDLLSAYYSQLNGSIVVDGETIEVGTKGSDGATDFIRFYISADDDRGTFDHVIREVEVSIDCVSIQAKNMGNDEVVDEMVNQVKQIISDISISNWVTELTLDMGTESASGETDMNYIVRRTITFKHFIRKT